MEFPNLQHLAVLPDRCKCFKMTTRICLLFLLAFISQQFCAAQNYCDNNQLFVEPSSTWSLTKVPYCFDCPDFNNDERNYHLYMGIPEDELWGQYSKRPVIIATPGYAFGNTACGPFLCPFGNAVSNQFTQFGFATVAVEYRQDIGQFNFCLTPEEEVFRTHWRAVQDLRRAIQFVHDNADQYGFDTDNVFLFANSAGGIASLHSTFVENEQELFDAKPGLEQAVADLGPFPERIDVQGCMTIATGIYSLEIINSHEQTPLFLAHGMCDSVAAYQSGTMLGCPDLPIIYGSYEIAARASQESVPVSFHAVDKLGHAWPEETGDSAAVLMRHWLKEQLLCGSAQTEVNYYLSDDKDCPTQDWNPIALGIDSETDPQQTWFFDERSALLKRKANLPGNRVFIFNTTGQLLREWESNEEELSLQSLPKGIYLVFEEGLSSASRILWR